MDSEDEDAVDTALGLRGPSAEARAKINDYRMCLLVSHVQDTRPRGRAGQQSLRLGIHYPGVKGERGGEKNILLIILNHIKLYKLYIVYIKYVSIYIYLYLCMQIHTSDINLQVILETVPSHWTSRRECRLISLTLEHPWVVVLGYYNCSFTFICDIE